MGKTFKIQNGMTVALCLGGNIARRTQHQIVTGTITKIGREYFYVAAPKCFHEVIKFDLEDFSYCGRDDNSEYILFESIEEAQKELERTEMLRKIRWNISNLALNDLPYEDVKTIYDILKACLDKNKRSTI